MSVILSYDDHVTQEMEHTFHAGDGAYSTARILCKFLRLLFVVKILIDVLAVVLEG